MSKPSLNRIWEKRMFAGGMLVATLRFRWGQQLWQRKKRKRPTRISGESAIGSGADPAGHTRVDRRSGWKPESARGRRESVYEVGTLSTKARSVPRRPRHWGPNRHRNRGRPDGRWPDTRHTTRDDRNNRQRDTHRSAERPTARSDPVGRCRGSGNKRKNYNRGAGRRGPGCD
jgi:hypothetical protein